MPLKVCTAMAADISAASMLTGALGLLLDRKFNLENIDECIIAIVKDTKTKEKYQYLSGTKAI